MAEWNFAIDYALELHSSDEMEFLKIKGECWDLADFFETEKYPEFTAYCHKKTNSNSNHGEDGPENENDVIKEKYKGDRTHTSFTSWMTKIYKKCRM